MPPKLSYGLNLPNKRPQLNGPSSLGKPNLAAGQKRKKTIFDDSDSEDDRDEKRGVKDNRDDGAVEITTLGGLDDTATTSQKSEVSSKKPMQLTAKSSLAGHPGGEKPSIKPLKNSIFVDDENEEEQESAPSDPGKKSSKPAQKFTGTNKDYANLAVLHSSRKHAKEAEGIDSSIYSYDAVYDSIKAKREKPNKDTENDREGGSRYMDNLLRSAEVRKRDQVRARDRLLAREREAEGDEFADKDKFVTAAYRVQQEEIKQMEEEEAKREKEEEERRQKNGGSGMVGFYRDMLARDEEQHVEAMKAAQEAVKKVAAGELPEESTAQDRERKEKTDAQIAAELNARGANIAVNDEGQVVDKRQLLSAGLNVAPKPKTKPVPTTTGPSTSSRPGARLPTADTHASRNAQRARQTEMIAKQLEEQAKQEEDAEAARQKELAEKNRSRKTGTDVESARERYLARKREREAKAKGCGGS